VNRRTVALILAAFVAGGAIVWAGIAIFGGSDTKKVAGPAETTTTTLPLSSTAQELLDRLKKGNALELHATYTSAADASGTTIKVEIWRKGGKVRQDVVLSGSGVQTQIEGLQLPDGNVACQKPAASDWVCQRVASVANQAGATAGIFDSAAASLNGKDVTATDEKVGADDARCYHIADAGTASASSSPASASSSATDTESSSSAAPAGTTMCITSEGVPVRVASASSDLTLSSVERSVDDAAFAPPAAITEPTTPTTAN
jgi:hypothetical protein